MKEKVRSATMFVLAGLAFYYGYTQRHEARIQRAKVESLYRQMELLRQEAEAARLEAARWRKAVEMEREAAQKAIEEYRKSINK